MNTITIVASLLLWGSVIAYSPWWTAPVCILLYILGNNLK